MGGWLSILAATLLGGGASLALGLSTGPGSGFSSVSAFADDAPLVNESFEAGSTTLPPGWVFAEFDKGVSSATIVGGASRGADGSHYLEISSPNDNHARVELTLSVAPHSSYQFHAMITSSATKKGLAGAVLGVDGQTGVSAAPATSDQWSPVDLFVTTGSQTSVVFTVGLGNFGQENRGKADFDLITLTRVDTIPPSATTVDLPDAAAQAAKAAVTLSDSMTFPSPNHLILPLTLVLGLLLIGAGAYLARHPAVKEATE